MTPIRWILVLPAAIAAAIAAYLAGLLVWKLVFYINIVPLGQIEGTLATAGAGAASAAAGVGAAAYTAPAHKAWVAKAFCVLLIAAFALTMLGIGPLASPIAPIPTTWRITLVLGWVAGAILAARAFTTDRKPDE